MKDKAAKIASLAALLWIGKWLFIHSFPQALALSSFGERWKNNHHTINKKMRRDTTKSHLYAVKNPNNGEVAVQFKAILKHLYIGRLVFLYSCSIKHPGEFNKPSYIH